MIPHLCYLQNIGEIYCVNFLEIYTWLLSDGCTRDKLIFSSGSRSRLGLSLSSSEHFLRARRRRLCFYPSRLESYIHVPFGDAGPPFKLSVGYIVSHFIDGHPSLMLLWRMKQRKLEKGITWAMQRVSKMLYSLFCYVDAQSLSRFMHTRTIFFHLEYIISYFPSHVK